MRRKAVIFNIFPLFISLLFSIGLHAQSSKALERLKKGDELRVKYRFEDSLDAYEEALASFADSLLTAEDSLLKLEISDHMLMAENGLSMMDFVYSPEVVAKHKFSIEDFFLYYPLKEDAWRKTPYQLDSLDHKYSKAAYLPEGTDVIYWSAADKDGIRNIYRSEYQDSVWTVPSLLNEQMTTASDEIYPMLSSDGKRMFFSSAGLHGVGGYDIYVSELDPATSEWSVPVNMGFPYSSPADDFLYIDTDDSRYSFFASNRDCEKDSVWIYVLDYDDMPVRKAVTDPDELMKIAQLNPVHDMESDPHETAADTPESEDTGRYMELMSQIRSLNDSISIIGTMIAEKVSVGEPVEEYEAQLPRLKESVRAASADLQKIEMELLFRGVVLDPEKLMAEADKEILSHETDFVFTKNDFGGPLHLNMLEPEPEFDYSFKILDVGQFAEDNTLPKGLVYQIQIFSTSNKVDETRLKGLSPVFETRTPTGKYIYRVGLFRTYNDVLANLNAVKKVGFRSAFITAFNDGSELSVSKAKALETELKKKKSFYEVRIIPSGELDATFIGGIRQQAEGKDIARVEKEDGTIMYVVGSFADKDTADKLVTFIKAMGVSDTSSHEIPQKK